MVTNLFSKEVGSSFQQRNTKVNPDASENQNFPEYVDQMQQVFQK